MADIKAEENRLRRALRQQGYRLHKSARRNPNAMGYGLYAITEGNEARPADHDAFTLTLDDVEAAMDSPWRLGDYSGAVKDDIIWAYDPEANSSAILLRLLEDGRVRITERSYYGDNSAPESEWNGRTRVYDLGDIVDGSRLRADLRRGAQLALLLDRVSAGLEVDEHDCGSLSPDAQKAEEELTRLLEFGTKEGGAYRPVQYNIWTAAEWYEQYPGQKLLDLCGLTPESSDEEVDTAVDNQIDEGRAQFALLTWGEVRRLILRTIEEVRDQDDV